MQGGGGSLARQNSNVTPMTNHMAKRSLNSEVRRKELMKITIENQAILKRLQDKTSNYSVQKWEEDFKETEKRMKNMCEYPFALFTDGKKTESSAETRYYTNNEGIPDDKSYISRGSGLPRIGTGVSGHRSVNKSFTTLNGA